MDFWYELDYLTNVGFIAYGRRDNRTYTNVSPQLANSIDKDIFRATLDGKSLYEAYDSYYRIGDDHSPAQLKIKLEEPTYDIFRTALAEVANLILNLTKKHFRDNNQLEQMAFEQFGQGTLFDTELNDRGEPRRPPEFRVHMMDGSRKIKLNEQYDRFHKIVNITQLLGLTGSSERWIEIDKCIGLASEIDSICKPKQSYEVTPVGSNPKNQPIDESRLKDLRNKWLKLNTTRDVDNKIFSINQT